MNTSLINLYKSESSDVVNSLKNEEITEFIDLVLDAYKQERKIFACGNGGNVASVGNLVVDLNMHPFVSDDKSSSNTKRNKFGKAGEEVVPKLWTEGKTYEASPDGESNWNVVSGCVTRRHVLQSIGSKIRGKIVLLMLLMAFAFVFSHMPSGGCNSSFVKNSAALLLPPLL